MKKSYSEILKRCEVLQTKDETKFLLNIPKQIPEQGVIVEIGSYKGGSTYMLAEGTKINKKGKVYTIDPNISNLQSLKENIKNAGVEDRVTIITKTSENAAKRWKKPISLLFIDGNHDYPFVKMDFLSWEKYLVKGGIIAFHDSRDSEREMLFNNSRHSYYSGPRRVVKENILNSNRFKNIGFEDTITYAEKVRDAYIWESLKNIFSLYWCKLVILPKKFSQIIDKFDQRIGKFGIFLKYHNPKLYFRLKKLKNKFGLK